MFRLVNRNLNKIDFKRYKTNFLKEKKEIDKKNQYLVGTCLTGFVLLTSGALYLRRRFENKKIDSVVDTISFNEFFHKYLLECKVSSIIYQPPFSVADVYLIESIENKNLSEIEKIRSNFVQRFTSKKHESLVRPPDIRVIFEDDSKVFKEIIDDINKNMKQKNGDLYKEINVDINDFPSNKEFFLITFTTTILAGIIFSM